VEKVEAARSGGGRIVAVGTTSLRVLETAGASGSLSAGEGCTDLYVYPGFSFRVADAMITNFHLPKSSLLLLVAAFAGKERILNAYREAIAADFRFYSYGDAMLIL
jgi:S-adenosylmethionine:tRNA ribosyltransferase-isomerase